MAKVTTTFDADESALLRAQKKIDEGEKSNQREMEKTAEVAERTSKRVTAAKEKAARMPQSQTYYSGSQEVHTAAYWRRQQAGIKQIERTLQPRRQPLSTAESVMILQTNARTTKELYARKLMEGRENRYAAGARFAGVDTTDLDAVKAYRNAAAGRMRDERGRSRARNLSTMVGDAYAGLQGEWAGRSARIKGAQDEAYDAKIAANQWHEQKAKQMRDRVAMSTLAVGAALTGFAAKVDHEMERYAAVISSGERALAGAYGVGSNGLRRGQIRADVISGSISSGLSLQSVGELRGRMDSAFEDIPGEAKREAERAAMQYSRLGVTNATGTAMGLGAAYQFYGKQLGGGANAMKTLTNRMAYSADVGAFDPNEVTPYLANVLGTFQALGYSDSEGFAALASASKSGMRAETFTTGLRNLPLMMTKKNFKKTGSFAGDMESLGGMSDEKLIDLVGRDAFPVVAILRKNIPQMREYQKQLEGLGPDSNVLGNKINQGRANDPMSITADVLDSARQLQENAPLMQMQDPLMGKSIEDWELRNAGAAREVHPMFSMLAKPAAWIETARSYLGNDGEASHSLLNAGARELINAKRSSGDNFMADYLSLKYNPDSDFWSTDKQGNRQYAGDEQAEQLRSLYQRGFTDVSAGELMQYNTFQANGGDADGYLNRVGKAKGGKAGGGGTGTAAKQLSQAAAMLQAAAQTLGGGGPVTQPTNARGAVAQKD